MAGHSAGTSRRHLRTAVRVGGAATGLVLLAPGIAVATAPSAAPGSEPDFEAPFTCGQDWYASTRSDHSPSVLSVDFNRDDDFRAPVLMSAPGVVTDVVDTGSTSYGKYVVVDHGRSWSSLYAHLDVQFVVEGQWLDQGDSVGLLGTSGGSTGPHLHFEERLDRVNQHAVFHGRRLAYGTTINSFNCGDVPITGNWGGDRRSDVGVFRPRPTGGLFRLRMPDGSVDRIALGGTVDRPVTGDWNGDGRTEVGVWKRKQRTFVLRGTGGKTRSVRFGARRDVPLTGDWDGDGASDLGVFRPRREVVRLRAADGRVTRVRFGDTGSVPVTGDWNGDGRTDLAAFDVRTGVWDVRSGKTGKVRQVSFGRVGTLPVTGDWNGDGTDTLGTWSPGNRKFRQQDAARTTTVLFGKKRH